MRYPNLALKLRFKLALERIIPTEGIDLPPEGMEFHEAGPVRSGSGPASSPGLKAGALQTMQTGRPTTRWVGPYVLIIHLLRLSPPGSPRRTDSPQPGGG